MIPKLKTKSRIKVWLNRFGATLGFIGILFVIERLYTYHHQLSFNDWHWYYYFFLGLLCVAYSVTNLQLALGWHFVLSSSAAGQPLKWCIRTYAITQLAKYVPGNIFQFASRQVIGVTAGIPNSVLIKSVFLELLFLSTAAGVLAPLFFEKLIPSPFIDVGFMLYFLAIIISLCLVFLFLPQKLVFAGLSYAGHVVTSGIIFLGVFLLSGGQIDTAFAALTIMAGYAISWLIGLLTPGSPAGIGVREAALVFLLGGITMPSTLLTAALLSRVVTVTGDLLFYIQGNSLR